MEAISANFKSQGSPLSVRIEQSSSQSDPTANSTINFEIYFGSSIDTTTFSNADISFASGTASISTYSLTEDLASSHTHWALSVTASTAGTVVPTIAANTVASTSGSFFSASSGGDNSVTYGSPAVLSIAPITTNDFGDVAVGTTSSDLTFRVTHTSGIVGATLSGASIFGTPIPFAVSNTTCGTTISVGASCDIDVHFSPTISGIQSNTLSLSYNNGLTNTSATYAVMGTGKTRALLSISPTPLDFGSLPVGGTNNQHFTLTNSGELDATGIADALSGEFVYASGGFSVSPGNCGTTLAGNSSCDIYVVFSPTTPGSKTGSLDLNYFDGVSSILTSASFTGTGVSVGHLTISDTDNYDFMDVTVNATGTHTFIVTNDGGYYAFPSGISGLAAPFSVTSTTCSGAVNSGATCTIDVAFNPTTPVTAITNTMTLTYSDGITSGKTVSRGMQGNGLTAAVLTISDPNYDFGSVVPGSTLQKTFTITNSGESTATGMIFSGLAAPYTINGGTCGTTLAGNGGQCTIDVVFNPVTASGLTTDTIILDYNDGAAPQTVNRAIQGTVSIPSVQAVYPLNGAKWLDFVAADGADEFSATDLTCSGTGSLYSLCVHGGEKLKVVLSGFSSCSNISAADNLLAFEWICKVVGGTATIYSTGLKPQKNLSDLLNPSTPGFRTNFVTVYNNGSSIFSTASATWWANTVLDLASNTILTGNIYVVLTNKTVHSLTISGNKTALVVMPGSTLTTDNLSTPSIPAALVTVSSAVKYVWIEGQFAGVFNSASEPTHGVSFSSGNRYFNARNITVSGFNRSGGGGLYVQAGVAGQIANIKSSSNTHGVYLNGIGGSGIRDLTMANNNYGLNCGSCSGDVFVNLKAYNNTSSGVYFNGSSQTFVYKVLATGNGSKGVEVTSGTSLTLGFITAMNNLSYGLYLSLNSSSTIFQVQAGNNGVGLYGAGAGTGNKYSQIVAANNGIGVQWDLNVNDAANTSFQNYLLVGNSSSKDCGMTAGTTPIFSDVSCGYANLITGININNVVKGVVVTNDTSNSSDTNGAATYNVSLDWFNFLNPFRTWGLFNNGTNRSYCNGTSTSCNIFDWSYSSSATQVINRSTDGTNAQSFVSGATCPLAVAGNFTMVDGYTGNPFLVNAVESLGDYGSGNKNGLCESGEICIYQPNFGAYFGEESSSLAACNFNQNGGSVSGVTIKGFTVNGN
jgi:hypothetical protein